MINGAVYCCRGESYFVNDEFVNCGTKRWQCVPRYFPGITKTNNEILPVLSPFSMHEIEAMSFWLRRSSA